VVTSKTDGNHFARRTRIAGRQAQMVAVQISAMDHIAGMTLSPVRGQPQVNSECVKYLDARESLTSLVSTITEPDNEFETNDARYASPFEHSVSVTVHHRKV